MEIKTITCHNVYNFGASLQTYALMHYLNNKGHNVEVIDYVPEYVKKNTGLWAIGNRWKKNIFIKLAYYCYVVPLRIQQLKSHKKFDEFTNKYIKLTRRYNSYEDLKSEPPLADLYICGSDQIWNPLMKNGLDSAFYLDFAPKGTKKASYAASFSIKCIPNEYKDFIKEKISKLNYVSVREKSAINILEDLQISIEYIQVVDPVFLISNKHWNEICIKPNFKDYILVYDQENNKEIKNMAKRYAKLTNKKIVAFKELYPRNYADKIIKYAGPLEFLGLISNADIILTNSFHCTAFSIIMNKKFFVFPRNHQKVNSRMYDLLASLDIIDRYVNDSIKDFGEQINYEKVNSKLEQIKHISINYLNKITNIL